MCALAVAVLALSGTAQKSVDQRSASGKNSQADKERRSKAPRDACTAVASIKRIPMSESDTKMLAPMPKTGDEKMVKPAPGCPGD